MKALFAGLIVALMSAPALAGWGAIAYNSQSATWGEAHGHNCYADAVNAAMSACGAGCNLINWEQNSCIALADGPGVWGESHGYGDSSSATQAAENACGAGCSWRVWSCN